MVGDTEKDLKQQNSFAMPESSQSFDDSTPQSTPPIEIDGSKRHFHYEKKTLFSPSQSDVKNDVDHSGESYPRSAIVSGNLQVRIKSQTLASPPCGRYLNIPQPSTDSIDRVGRKELDSEARTRRRVRALTRQDYVNEDDTAIACQLNVLSKGNASENTQPARTTKLADDKLTSRSTGHMIQASDNSLKQNLTCILESGNRLNIEQTPQPGESHISQTIPFPKHNAKEKTRMDWQDEIQNQSDLTSSKRFIYRRGGSDRTGAKWLSRFRKSKNWSVTSMIPPKLKNRTTSESRNNTAIKIVIDHATDVSETWLGDELDDTEDLSDVFIKKSPEAECGDLSVIAEQLTNPQGNALSNKSSTTSTTTKKTGTKNKNAKSWRSILRGNWKAVLARSENNNSKMEKHTLCDINARGRRRENLDQQFDTDMIKRITTSNKKKHHPVKSVPQRFPAELWSNIVDGSSKTNKPAVILPMPSFAMCSHDSISPHDGAENATVNALRTGQGDSGSTCKSTQDDQSDCDDSMRTSSNCAQRDSDLSSREDAELLRKRKEMNASTQFLRAKSAKTDDNQSLLDLNSVDLGRRWSVQSDAISIYSERQAKPLERSHSNCSRYSQKRSSKGSDHGHRRSFRQKWSSKKSSFASSTGSSFRRKRRRIAERKLAYSGISICIAFALCMLPISAVDMLQKLRVLDFVPDVTSGLIVLSWAHVVANPILYGFLNPQFRKEYKKIIEDFWNFIARKEQNRGLLSGRSAIVKAMRDQYQS